MRYMITFASGRAAFTDFEGAPRPKTPDGQSAPGAGNLHHIYVRAVKVEIGEGYQPYGPTFALAYNPDHVESVSDNDCG